MLFAYTSFFIFNSVSIVEDTCLNKLTLYALMDSFIWYDGMVHFHIERSHDLIYKYNCYFLEDRFYLDIQCRH